MSFHTVSYETETAPGPGFICFSRFHMVSYIADASQISKYINKEFRKQNAFSAAHSLPTATMSSVSPAPLLSAPSDKLLASATPDSPVPLKRTLDRSPSDRAGKRAKVKGPHEQKDLGRGA